MDHPNIIRYYDSFENVEEKTHFVVMELVPGDKDGFCDMGRFCNPDCTLTVGEKKRISLEVWKGLAYLHTRQVRRDGEDTRFIHRDMKPRNILVRY